jgi:hypothetical protein
VCLAGLRNLRVEPRQAEPAEWGDAEI